MGKGMGILPSGFWPSKPSKGEANVIRAGGEEEEDAPPVRFENASALGGKMEPILEADEEVDSISAVYESCNEDDEESAGLDADGPKPRFSFASKVRRTQTAPAAQKLPRKKSRRIYASKPQTISEPKSENNNNATEAGVITSLASKVKRTVTQFPSQLGAACQRQSEGSFTAGEESDHLCVMVHGLGGGPWDWTPIVMEIQRSQRDGDGNATGGCPDATKMHVHVSQANAFVKTFDGIDVCGERLADEIRDLAKARPNLKYLSVIGHSLGGLIARYAIGALFCEETRTMFGLRPLHFATIVSPHLGCGCDGDASSFNSENHVPFLRWIHEVPLIGRVTRGVVSLAAAPGASLLYGRTGTQLFLRDYRPPERDKSNPAVEPKVDVASLPVVFQMAVNGLLSEREVLRMLARMQNKDTDASGDDEEEDEGSGQMLEGKWDSRKRLIPFGSALLAFGSRTLYSNVQGDHMVSWSNASIRKVSQLPEEAAQSQTTGIVLDIAESTDGNQSAADGFMRGEKASMPAVVRLQDIMIESLQKVAWRRVDVKLRMRANALPHNYIQARPADQDSLTVTRHLMEVLAN